LYNNFGISKHRFNILIILYIFRDLENDFSDLTQKIDKRSSMSDISTKGGDVCPVCNEAEVKQGIESGKANVCAECEKTVCKDCGTYQTNVQTKVSRKYGVDVTNG
jgi:ribosomal protein L37AE/L43A